MEVFILQLLGSAKDFLLFIVDYLRTNSVYIISGYRSRGSVLAWSFLQVGR